MSNSEKLKILSQRTLDKLLADVPENVSERYLDKGFTDLANNEIGWGIIVSSVDLDSGLIEKVNELDQNAIADVNHVDREAAKSVFYALNGMKPALACQPRVWARLCHVELFPFCKRRWLLDSGEVPSEKVAIDRICDGSNPRFFSKTSRSYKRDNAVGRLWWSAYLADLARDEDKGFDFDKTLKIIFPVQDVINHLLDRIGITSSRPLLRGIVRAMDSNSDLNNREMFRIFMKIINRECGGQLFSLYKPAEVDSILNRCISMSKNYLKNNDNG